MSDRITLTGLQAFGRHGVFAHEREDGQLFVVDVTLRLDLTEAADTDDLSSTVDYGAVADTVVEVVGGDPCDLIETVAARIADKLATDERVESVEVTVHKPSAPITHEFTDVAVTISRTRS